MRVTSVSSISNISFLNNKKKVTEEEQTNVQWRKLINVPPLKPNLEGENNGKEEGLDWK